MKNEKDNNEGSVFRLCRYMSVILILLFVILAIILQLLDFGGSAVFDSPGLLSFLNLFFLFVCPMIVGYFAVKGYLDSGSITLFVLGGSVFSLVFWKSYRRVLTPGKSGERRYYDS